MTDIDERVTDPDPQSRVARALAGGSATRRSVFKAAAAGAASSLLTGGISARPAMAQSTPTAEGVRPNILFIMADDIGYWNTSVYNDGMMGYRTPNIDRIAKEGMRFTDAYGEQSCTAGRAAFITGQSPFRTGLLRIGLPGEDEGIHADDPTLAELLKPLGYATGQFGKNHLGDRNPYLPTVHGFDEFFGNLYHLNAEQEPENPDYPANPQFAARFGPRGVLHSYATDVDDPTEDPRFGRIGKQVIEDTGPLDTTRMQTVDEEFLAGAMDFIDRSHAADQPFFVWFNPSRMHIFTHLKPESEGVTGLGIFADGMVEHDGHVGQLLQQLDDLGITENTIVVYATDNGAEIFSWPDGGMTPFRGEKNSNWEGGFRIPMMVRWPEQIPAGTISNAVISLQDWVPTLMSAAGVPDVKDQLVGEGYDVGDKVMRAHLDGYDQLAHLTSGAPGARTEFFYFSDRGDLVGIRQLDRWKIILMEQRSEGMDVWFEEFTDLRTPRIVDLRADPFERAMNEANGYNDWLIERLFLLYPTREFVMQFAQSFAQFPPRGVVAQIEQIERVLNILENRNAG